MIVRFFVSCLFIGLLLSIAIAQQTTLGEFHINDNVTLVQNCLCDYVNFTRVINPNHDIIFSNLSAIKEGTYFSYNLNSTSSNIFGEYQVFGEANITGQGIVNFAYTYEVTKSENRTYALNLKSPEGIITMIILSILVIVSVWVGWALFGGFLVAIFGLLLVNNGIEWYISVPTILIGFFIMAGGSSLSLRKKDKR